MTTVSQSPANICAANIAILHLLHGVPAQPSKNENEGIHVHRQEYTLSFETEKKLTSTLAFLSNVKDDSSHIPAVAIVEYAQPSRLRVLVAVNEKSPGDGNQILQEIKSGMETVFSALYGNAEGANREDKVFTAIISMCSARILYRLRLVQPDRNKPKQTIKAALNEVIRSFQQLKSKRIKDNQDAIGLSIVKIRAVIKLVDAWTNHQTEDGLKSLISGLYDLRQVEQLPALLDAIPNVEMAPSSRKSVLNIVRKVARYREAARVLCRAVKKYPLVHKATVTAIQLPKTAFHRPAPTKPSTTLDSNLLRFPTSRKNGASDRILRLLQVRRDEAEKLFANRVKKTLGEAKFHAEIQIIFYCELDRTIKAPRIVCSSKDACFLCNVFITLYKGIYTPRCHGRLYPGWRLPQHPAFDELQRSFNHVLERSIDESLRLLLSRGKKTLYPDPNESTLFTLPYSASTLISASASSNEHIESDSETPDVPLVAEHCASNATPRISDEPEAVGIAAEPKDDSTASSSPAMITASLQLPEAPEDGDVYLVQGLQASASVNIDKPSRLYKAGQLEVQLEYWPDPSQPLPDIQGSSSIPVKIKWLTLEEVDILNQDKEFRVIEADLLSCGTDHNVKGRDYVYMSVGESVLGIEFCKDNQHIAT